ncbi:hypothetical protein L1887_22744 [Cichorium endivia]|nr:hypothetical protein L1887_22744 [Cichorium endivia]
MLNIASFGNSRIEICSTLSRTHRVVVNEKVSRQNLILFYDFNILHPLKSTPSLSSIHLLHFCSLHILLYLHQRISPLYLLTFRGIKQDFCREI